jgi:hypothetical protein
MVAVMSVPTTADLNFPAGSLSQARLARLLIRGAVLMCGAFLLFAAAFLWSRRAVGAISAPLSASSLLVVGLVMVAIALAARFVWQRTDATRAATLTVSGLLTVATLASAAATSLPGSAPIGLVGLWLVVVCEELWAWWPRRHTRSRPTATIAAEPPRQVPIAGSRGQFEQAVADSLLGLEVSQEHVTQQVTRLVEPDGTERVVGWMRVSFEPGQRLASVHLSFCPPFGRTPEATLERLEGPQVRIKRVQVFPFGARFDLKLSVPAEQRSDVLLQVAAEVHGQERADEAHVTVDGDG